MRARPHLLLVLLALAWGVNWPVAKIGLRDLPPFTYGAFRVATGLAVIVGLLAAGRGGACGCPTAETSPSSSRLAWARWRRGSR